MIDQRLERHRDVWRRKKILRVVYQTWYSWIVNGLSTVHGAVLEIGAGSGNFKEYLPAAISSDIEACQWVDVCHDAHYLPFREASISNIVMIDVLHHLADPVGFFHAAFKALAPGGKIFLIEPFPSPVSGIVYRKFHPEPFIMDVDYFTGARDMAKHPWEANQAIAYLLFFKHAKKMQVAMQEKFRITERRRISVFLYPLSGGFENRQLIPDALIVVAQLLEVLLAPFRFLMAFRCYVVLEKITAGGDGQ